MKTKKKPYDIDDIVSSAACILLLCVYWQRCILNVIGFEIAIATVENFIKC